MGVLSSSCSTRQNRPAQEQRLRVCGRDVSAARRQRPRRPPGALDGRLCRIHHGVRLCAPAPTKRRAVGHATHPHRTRRAGAGRCGVTGARAQELWGEIDLPGGVAAARQVASLGDGEHRLHSTFLLDFARKYASGERLERSVQRLATYLETIEYLRQDLEQWPDGIALPTPQTPREERTRLEALFDSMGLSLRSQDRQYRLQLSGSDGARERRALLQQVNVDTDGIVAALNSGTRLKVPIPHSTLPLPLPDWWSTEVFQRAAAQGSFMWSGQATTVPLLAILRNQSASYTYLGLMALDAETLRFLAERPRLVNTLRDLVGGAFATFSRSLRVRQGTVDLPGGAESAPLWSSLVGRSPSDPEGFLPSLLAADNGRLAYFYDTVASLAPPRQAFVLGTHLPAADRVAFVRRIYRKFVEVAPAWNITKAPFDRPTFDPAIALMFVDVLPAGTVGPPWWSGLLAQVFAQDSWPTEAGDSPRVVEHRTGRRCLARRVALCRPCTDHGALRRPAVRPAHVSHDRSPGSLERWT